MTNLAADKAYRAAMLADNWAPGLLIDGEPVTWQYVDGTKLDDDTLREYYEEHGAVYEPPPF